MKKRFLKIQFVFGLYVCIYLAALYFSTGYGVGFKLDDNQLIGLFSVFCSALLLTALFVVNFNEAFWYFIFFIFFIPISVIGNVIGFLIKK